MGQSVVLILAGTGEAANRCLPRVTDPYGFPDCGIAGGAATNGGAVWTGTVQRRLKMRATIDPAADA
jgi:hypothetical protein